MLKLIWFELLIIKKLVWLPTLSFTTSKIPDITSITIDDKINDTHDSCIEVTIKFSDGDRRYLTFTTVENLNKLFNEYRDYIIGNELIFLKEINEPIITQTIIDLDKKNEFSIGY